MSHAAAPIFGCLMLPSRFGSVMEPLLRRKRIPMDSNVGFLWQKYHQYFQWFDLSGREKTSTVSKGDENLSKYIELYLCYLYKCL